MIPEHMTIRWGMIGCGDVTERKSGPAFSLAPGSVLQGVWSRRPEKAQDYANRHHIPQVFDSAAALILSPEIDAVYVATPPAAHLEYALLVARAGKPCCVEKPMANSHADALAMCEAFEAAGQPLFVAHYRRSMARFIGVMKMISQPEFGELRHIHWWLTRPAKPADQQNKHWRIDPAQAPGGYFDDLASHGLDLFDMYAGPIEAASGLTTNQAGVTETPDAVTAHWKHASGVTGTGYWNFAANRSNDMVTLVGSKARIVFSVFEDKSPEMVEGEENIVEKAPVEQPIQLPHVIAMNRHLRGKETHPSLGRDGLRTAWVFDQIRGAPSNAP